MTKRVLGWLVVSVCILLGLSFSLPSLAQTTDPGINLQISPLPIELNAKPGTSVSADLRVRNGGSRPEKLVALVKAFSVEGTAGQVVFRDPGPSDEFVKWVNLSKTTFDAPVGEWQTVKMTINLPKEAAFGYYFAVQFQRATPVKPQPGTTGIEGAVAIFVLLNAEHPGAARKAEVTSFTANRKFYEFLPADFKVRIKSTGNVHIAPSGNIFIKRGKSQVGTVEVNRGQGNVLPGSSRIFTSAWSDGFPVYVEAAAAGKPSTNEKGELNRSLKWNLSDVPKLRIGHYTADLVMVYNDGQRDVPITASVSFWVIPWRLIFFVVAALVLPALLVYVLMRRRFKKRLNKELRKHGKSA